MKKTKQPTIGQLIRAARQSRGLTQEMLAKIARYEQSQLSRWENDIAAPELPTLRRLAEALGTSIIELIPEAD